MWSVEGRQRSSTHLLYELFWQPVQSVIQVLNSCTRIIMRKQTIENRVCSTGQYLRWRARNLSLDVDLEKSGSEDLQVNLKWTSESDFFHVRNADYALREIGRGHVKGSKQLSGVCPESVWTAWTVVVRYDTFRWKAVPFQWKSRVCSFFRRADDQALRQKNWVYSNVEKVDMVKLDDYIDRCRGL